MFFKYSASKNQLPGFYISGTWVENGLSRYFTQTGVSLVLCCYDENEFGIKYNCFCILITQRFLTWLFSLITTKWRKPRARNNRKPRFKDER